MSLLNVVKRLLPVKREAKQRADTSQRSRDLLEAAIAAKRDPSLPFLNENHEFVAGYR